MESEVMDYSYLVKKSEDRVITNKTSLIFFGLTLIILFGFLIYTLPYSNSKLVQETSRKVCVNTEVGSSKCTYEYLEIVKIISLSLFIASIIFGLFLALFRFLSSITVALISTIVLLLYGLSIYGILQLSGGGINTYHLQIPLLCFVISHIILIVISLAKLKLVGFLLQQTTKIVFSTQFRPLWILPLTELFSVIIILCLSFLSTYWMNTALSSPERTRTEFIVMTISIILNSCVTIWVVQIISTFFYMSISGAVATAYFNKFHNGFPMDGALKITMKYHLGSIIFGTFVIDVILLLFQTIFYFSRFEITNLIFFISCFIAYPIRIILVIPQFAFMDIAIHGSSFCDALNNIRNLFSSSRQIILFSVTILTDLIFLFIWGVTLLISSSVLGYELKSTDNNFVALQFAGSMTFVLFVVIFGIFRSTLESLLLCFCEHARISQRFSNSKDFYQFITSVDFRT